MLAECSDNTYGILATSQNSKKLVVMRLRPIDEASILPYVSPRKRRWTPVFTIRTLVAIIFAVIIIVLALVGIRISSIIFLLAIVAIDIVLIPTRMKYRYGSKGMLCNQVDNWQKISSKKFLGKRKIGFTEYNIYSLTINNEDYIVSLNEKEINKLRQAGIFF